MQDTPDIQISYLCKHKENKVCNGSNMCGNECKHCLDPKYADEESVNLINKFFEKFEIDCTDFPIWQIYITEKG